MSNKPSQYGDGSNSSIGPQLNTFKYDKKAIIEAAKESVFSALADTESMPKHMGKTIKKNQYMPLLDDRNINDQGIDANGASTQMGVTIQIAWSAGGKIKPGQNVGDTVKGEGVDASAALADAQALALSLLTEMNFVGADYAAKKADAISKGFFVDESVAYPVSGNLYGSSKDVGTIAAKLPILGEHGGEVNRVGFSRKTIEGSINKFGIYRQFTQESLDFDTDEELYMHLHSEMLKGANELTEDMIQSDLLNGAGVVMFAGDAIGNDEISGETGAVTEVEYNDFIKLSIEMNANRTPRQTKRITGSNLQDTKVVDNGWIMFVAPELEPTLRRLTDYSGDKALIEAKHYAAAGNLIKGELGTIGNFRIVVAQEMQRWAGSGATVSDNAGYSESAGKYDIFPMLVVGAEAFSTIGFQTDGKSTKFKIKNALPGSPESYANDPYGETGFSSIKWFYGTLIQHPERLAVIKTAARL